MKRLLPWMLIGLVALAAVAGWSVYSARQAAIQAARAVADVDVDVSMHGVELSRGAGGRTEWRLKADGARYQQDSGTAQVDNPRVVYYLDGSGGEGNGTVEVTAPHGEVNQETGAASLWPDVDILTGPTHVTADRLDYDGAARRIVLTGSVRMMRPGLVLTAPRAVLELDTNVISAEGGVTGDMRPVPARAKE